MDLRARVVVWRLKYKVLRWHEMDCRREVDIEGAPSEVRRGVDMKWTDSAGGPVGPTVSR
eukprot:755776-Hanusia_phi.AAC.3